MLTTTLYADPSVFETLAGEWNALSRRMTNHTLFQTLEWQRTWWRMLGEGRLHVLAIHDGADLVGIAPLFWAQPAELSVLGHKEVTDYVDVIFAHGHEHACFDALLAHLADQPWTQFNFYNVSESSPTAILLPQLAAERGLQVSMRVEDVCPIIPLPATFEHYLAMLDGKERRELQRKMRRLHDDTRILYAGDSATLDAEVSEFIRLMKLSTFAKSDFMTGRMERAFHAIAREMFDAGWLQLAFLEIDGVRAAAYMNFVYDGEVLVYNSGLEPTKFAALSPGQVLIGKLIERAIEQKLRVFDFLQGNEEYKYKLGAKDTRVHTIQIGR